MGGNLGGPCEVPVGLGWCVEPGQDLYVLGRNASDAKCVHHRKGAESAADSSNTGVHDWNPGIYQVAI